MGFGLQSAPGFWCKLMDCTFSALPFVKYWVDDIFYGSQDTSTKSQYEVHLEQTKQVFQACRANGIRLSTLKTRFGLREIVFGGHCISKGKYSPEPKKIDAIRRAAIPTTVGELMRFLGAINWVGKYCPLLSRRTYHLRKHLKLATGAPVGSAEHDVKEGQRQDLLEHTKEVTRRVVVPFKRKNVSDQDVTVLLSRRSVDRKWEFPWVDSKDVRGEVTAQAGCVRAVDKILVNIVGLSRRFFTPAELPRAMAVVRSGDLALRPYAARLIANAEPIQNSDYAEHEWIRLDDVPGWISADLTLETQAILDSVGPSVMRNQLRSLSMS